MNHITQEFVVEFLNGQKDWMHASAYPVLDFYETEDTIIVDKGYKYTYDKAKIAKWVVRDYSPETTYDNIE